MVGSRRMSVSLAPTCWKCTVSGMLVERYCISEPKLPVCNLPAFAPVVVQELPEKRHFLVLHQQGVMAAAAFGLLN